MLLRRLWLQRKLLDPPLHQAAPAQSSLTPAAPTVVERQPALHQLVFCEAKDWEVRAAAQAREGRGRGRGEMQGRSRALLGRRMWPSMHTIQRRRGGRRGVPTERQATQRVLALRQADSIAQDAASHCRALRSAAPAQFESPPIAAQQSRQNRKGRCVALQGAAVHCT